MSEVQNTTTTTAAAAPRRVVPKIGQGGSTVGLDAETFTCRHWLVRLAKGSVLQDLIDDPTLFSAMQTGGRPMQRRDRVEVVAHDESVIAFCICSNANRDGATLSKPLAMIDMTSRNTQTLPGDEKYQIEWGDGGYVVIRKSDKHVMTPPVQSLDACEKHMRSLWPTKAS